jgi:cytochrome b
MTSATRIRVWDRFVRLFHWSLVVAFFTAWFATDSIGWVHKGAGYVTVVLVGARVLWGLVGSPHARFVNFVPGPRTLLAYLQALVRGREPRHLGHNPAGAVMVLGLMAAVLGIGITGWLMTLDAFWGNDTVESLHTLLVDATLVAVAVHVAANVLGSLRHRENLIAAMVTGDKPAQAACSASCPPPVDLNGRVRPSR